MPKTLRMLKHKTIAVFGSSSSKPGGADYLLAHDLGKAIAQKGGVVVNGGYGGVMEASAKGAQSVGGHTIGITTQEFRSVCNPYIAEEKQVSTWQERVFALMSIADAYVILNGGTGTLVEFSVAVEMLNKGFISKKPIVAYGPFWREVKTVLEKNKEIRMDFVKTASTLDEIIQLLF